MKSKKTAFIVIIIAVILLLVASWLIYSKFFKKVEEKKDVPLATDDTGVEPAPTINNNPVVGSGPVDVKAFQDWMDINHPNWVKGKSLNKKSGYGTYGPSTQSAWALWKDAFQNIRGTIGTIIPITTPNTLPATNLISKGDTVYSRMSTTALFQYPDGNSLMGNIFYTDSTKPIGVFDSYVGGTNFAKVLMNKNGVTLNTFLIKAPYTAYVYKSLIKK